MRNTLDEVDESNDLYKTAVIVASFFTFATFVNFLPLRAHQALLRLWPL